MYSALYYPHTEVQNAGLIRTALLLWDELHYIVPYEGFPVQYERKEEQEAIELIGKPRIPSSEEQKAAHELIEDFATRPLPRAFQYIADVSRRTYELYPQKLMPQTWKLLKELGLVGDLLPNSDYPSTTETGLSVMSILADCCAGTSLSRVTDHDAAYAVIAGALVEEEPEQAIQSSRRELVPILLEVASLEAIPLRKLIDFRKNEARKGASAGTTRLRHNLVADVNSHAKELAAAQTEADRTELKRLYKQKLQVNLKDLREALKLESTAVITSKEILAAIAGVATAALTIPVPAVSASATALTIGGLLNIKAKFARTRAAILEKNPTAYLYEAAGGFARY